MIRINFFRVLKFLIIFLLFSCNYSKNDEKENSYQILSLITNVINEKSITPPVFPPPPNGMEYKFTTKDSLEVYKLFYERYTKKKIIAFEKEMFSISNIGLKMDSLIHRNKRLVSKLEKIDVNKISLIKKDSMLYNTSKHKGDLGKGIDNIDFSLSFSEITFNKNFTKAYLIVNISFEKLNSLSTIIYLEKNKYNWKIKFKKILSIS